jgi:hypothetical protein
VAMVNVTTAKAAPWMPKEQETLPAGKSQEK